MRIYRLAPEEGRDIRAFGSRHFKMTGMIRESSAAHIGCMQLGASGLVGRHEAPVPQLLLVLAGEALVSGSDGVQVRITEGEAAYWDQGEIHETKSENGLTALIVESEKMTVLLPER